MLSGQGWTAVAGCRQFFYARYIDWMITFPLITVLLGFIAGSEWSTILGAIGAQRKCPPPPRASVRYPAVPPFQSRKGQHYPPLRSSCRRR